MKILILLLISILLHSNNISQEDIKKWSQVNKILSEWKPSLKNKKLQATIKMNISKNGNMTYVFIKKSKNKIFNLELELFLEKKRKIKFPNFKKDKKLNVDFKNKG